MQAKLLSNMLCAWEYICHRIVIIDVCQWFVWRWKFELIDGLLNTAFSALADVRIILAATECRCEAKVCVVHRLSVIPSTSVA